MAPGRFKKVCVDALDPLRLGRWWGQVLEREWRPADNGEGGLFGPTPRHTLWFCRVPEAKSVKHRVHLDVYTRSVGDLEALGATVVLPQGADRRWTVMVDPEGGEFCAFLREELPAERLHGLVVDSVDPAAQADWWARVFEAPVVHDDSGYSTVEHVPGMPILTMDFVPVPEPKTVKNRIHWEVTVADVQPLLTAGATLLRRPDEEIGWYVLADPEGNEFCAFVSPDAAF